MERQPVVIAFPIPNRRVFLAVTPVSFLETRTVTASLTRWEGRGKTVFRRGQFIPGEEGGQHLRHLVRRVLVHRVADLRQNLHLELALHLAHGEVSVQPVHPGQQQQLGRGDGQEPGGQAAEPAGPVGLGGRQVYPPGVAAVWGGFWRWHCVSLLLSLVLFFFLHYRVLTCDPRLSCRSS